MPRSFPKSIVVLLIAAVLFYATAQFLLLGLETNSTEFPIHLQKGREYAGDFLSKWNVHYEIRLQSERKLDLQEQNCLLGIETIVPELCSGISPELLLSWRVETDNSLVASGNSDDTNAGYWGLKMGKILGSFPVTKGVSYDVQIQIGKTSSKLQLTNPRVKIIIREEDLKWSYVWIGILSQAAAFCFLLALILLLIFCGRNIRARTNTIDR